MTPRPIRLILTSLALALLLPACTSPTSSSPSVSVPASVQSAAASAAGSGLEAFCDVDLANDPEIAAVIQSAQSVTTGGNADGEAIRGQVDAAASEIEALDVPGEATGARDRLVDALNAYGDNPSQATATALLAAHLTAAQAQRASCGG